MAPAPAPSVCQSQQKSGNQFPGTRLPQLETNRHQAWAQRNAQNTAASGQELKQPCTQTQHFIPSAFTSAHSKCSNRDEQQGK